MIDGVEQGRNGLGNIYVFAGGNDALNGNEVYSNVNYNGFANSRYAIAVAAIDRNGEKTLYSEPGAAILVSANSGDGGIGITTTDLVGNAGYNNPLLSGLDLSNGDYTRQFSGTSAAAPIVSGVVALMLEANPNLTWRDVQHILVRTADKNHASDQDWLQNGAGRWVNHKYGFGAVDAQEAVQLAKTWVTVPSEVSISSPVQQINQTIPDGNPSGLTSTIQINEDIQLEKIEIAFDATHAYRGDLKVVLTSPSGTQSILAEKHFLAPDPNPNDTFNPNEDYDQWTFTSARHWGESSQGTWTLAVYDEAGNQIEGMLKSWQLELFGTNTPLPDPNLPSIPLNHWNTRLINRNATNYADRATYDFSRPDAVLDLGSQNWLWSDGRLGLVKDWGIYPEPGIQLDYFAMEAWTRYQFEAGKLYKISSRSDDGVAVKLKNPRTGQWVNEETSMWFDSSIHEPHERYFTVSDTGEYDTYIYYYERESGAKVDINIAPTTFNARVISTIGANVRSTPNTSQPPVGVIPSGQTVTFDQWVRGQFIDYTQELGQASSLWYRIAGSQPEQWVSAAILDADLDAVPL